MKARIANTFAGCFMLLASTTSSAEDSMTYPLYAGFALGFASAATSCYYYSYDCDGTDTTFKLYAGKRLHENFGVEIAYHDLGKLRNNEFFSSTTAESDGINLSLLGIIPLSDRGYFYGKVGYMSWDADYTYSGSSITREESGTDTTYGMGIAFNANPKFDFRMEIERLNEFGDDFTHGGAEVLVLYFAGNVNFY